MAFQALTIQSGKTQQLGANVLLVGTGVDALAAGSLTVGAATATSVVLGSATIPVSFWSPTVKGTSTWSAPTNGTTTYSGTQNIAPTPVQTTSGSHTSVVVATIPLPGTTGAPSTKGQCDIDYDVSATGTTTAVAARWKGSVSYTLQTVGSPVLLSNQQPFSTGTNSTAVPASWTLTAALDGTSHNVTLSITTDASDTYSVNAITQVKYTQ